MEMEGLNSSKIAQKEADFFAKWDSTLTFVLNLKMNNEKSIEQQKKVDLTKDSIAQLINNYKADEAKKAKEKSNPKNNEVLFRIQITSSSKKIPLNSRKFKDMPSVFEYESNGIFKYAVGNCVTMDEAAALQREVKAKVYNDAFVVAFYKGDRVSVKKAKELIAEGKQ